MKIIERIVNTETNETIDIEREETAQEKIQREARELDFAEKQAAAEAKEAARSAVLTKLGLTAEEAQALLG